MSTWLVVAQLVWSIVLTGVSLLILAPLRRLADRVEDVGDRLAYIEGQLKADELDRLRSLTESPLRRRKANRRDEDG